MEKIISLFQRNYDGDRLVRDEVVHGAEWVIAGEGVATRKFDGTCCMIKDGQLFKRYDAKHGKQPPTNFIPAQPEPDPQTGHWPGWLQITPDDPADRWHWLAWKQLQETNGFLRQQAQEGTYELCGPKVQGNAENFRLHLLIKHGNEVLVPEPGRTFDGIKEYLENNDIEGVVWHHPDGRMVKIKAKDFGLKRVMRLSYSSEEFCDCNLIILTKFIDGYWLCLICNMLIRCAFKHSEEDQTPHPSSLKHIMTGLYTCSIHEVDADEFASKQDG